MWVCLNKAFLSIVDHSDVPGALLVRARVKGHIEAIFPGAKVVTLVGRDYQFRADVDRALVGATIAQHIADITYPNFKNSVKNDRLHDAYAKVWRVMADLQPIAPYATRPRPAVRKAKPSGDLDFFRN